MKITFSTMMSAMLLAAPMGSASELGVESYERVLAERADYSTPIDNPFQWTADNIERKKGCPLAAAWLFALQRDLDGDRVTELLVSGKELVANGGTTYVVFKVSNDSKVYSYIGTLEISEDRIGVFNEPDGSVSVVTGGQHAGKFYVIYYQNNGRHFSIKAREEYDVVDEKVTGLPRRVISMFPDLK